MAITLNQAWEMYEQDVMEGEGLTPEQMLDHKCSFFSGAIALRAILEDACERSEDEQEAACKVLDAEFKAFEEMVEAEAAKEREARHGRAV